MNNIQSRHIWTLVVVLLVGIFLFLLTNNRMQTKFNSNSTKNYPIENTSFLADPIISSTFESTSIYAKHLRINTQHNPPTYSDTTGNLLNGLYEIIYKRRLPYSDTAEDHLYMSETGEFKKGLKEGIWCVYPPFNEIMHYKEEYENGSLTGDFIVYNEKQIIHYKTNFHNGNGVWKSFYVTGRLRLEAPYQHGLEHGTWREYNPDGTLKEETYYKQGVLQTMPSH